ncbi:MAG: hypothetical protein E7467_02870 [Ruminococcaceae bacterium]|nr:hypothetical protein [Oscillospiraceae bacterium]
MKRFIAFIILFALLCALVPQASAAILTPYEVEGGCLYFDKYTGYIVDADDTITRADIPEKIRGVDVIGLGSGVFMWCNSLTEVSIPKTLVDIQEFAFSGSESLTAIRVSAENERYSSDEQGLLMNKEQSLLIFVPTALTGDLVIPMSVTQLQLGAIEACHSLTSITALGLESLVDYAFSCYSKLNSITLGKELKSIGFGAFAYCEHLGEIIIDSENPWFCTDEFGALYSKDMTELIRVPTAVPASYRIPESVTKLREYACYYCENLSFIRVPDGVTELPTEVFSFTFAKSIVIPSSVKTLGEFSLRTHRNGTAIYFCGKIPEFEWWGTTITTECVVFYAEDEAGALDLLYNHGVLIAPWDGKHIHSFHWETSEPTCTKPYFSYDLCECGFYLRESDNLAKSHLFYEGECSICGTADPKLAATAFSDVTQESWYAPAVGFAVQHDLMNGVAEGEFAPDATMTRAMLVTVLWRYEGEPEGGENPFTDVAEDTWYTEAVTWAAENGVVGGIGGGKFDPDGKITREQLATILHRYAKSKGLYALAPGSAWQYYDAEEISRYAFLPMCWAANECLITGVDEYLLPQGHATRAQVATILMRFIERNA